MSARGLEDLLAVGSGLSVVDVCHDGTDALRAVYAHRPDIVLLDFSLPSMTGREVLSWLRDDKQPVHVVMFSASMSREDVLDVLTLNVDGLLHKVASADEILECLRAVAAGEQWLSETMLRISVGAASSDARPLENPLYRLTKRQMDVAVEVAKGQTNREVAASLNISKPVVDAHMKLIFSKLKITDRSSLAILINQWLEEGGLAASGDPEPSA